MNSHPKTFVMANDPDNKTSNALKSLLYKLGIKSALGIPLTVVIPKAGIYQVSITSDGVQEVNVQRFTKGAFIHRFADQILAQEL